MKDGNVLLKVFMYRTILHCLLNKVVYYLPNMSFINVVITLNDFREDWSLARHLEICKRPGP